MRTPKKSSGAGHFTCMNLWHDENTLRTPTEGDEWAGGGGRRWEGGEVTAPTPAIYTEADTNTVIFTRVEVTRSWLSSQSKTSSTLFQATQAAPTPTQTKMKLLLVFLIVVGCALAYPRTNRRSYNTRESAQRFKCPRKAIAVTDSNDILISTEAARLQAARVQAARLHAVRPQALRRSSAVVRPRRAPIQRTMLISGYYSPYRPQLLRRQGLEPDAAMAAFASGDSVAAGSYLGSNFGPNCVSCDPAVEQDNSELLGAPEADPVEDYPEAPLGLAPVADAPLGLAPVADAPFNEEAVDVPKRRPNKLAENDDEEQDSFPLKNTRDSNSYFPVSFGSNPRTRSGAGGSGGGVTAIANSYSTGKGGVATSHATAYGGAPPKSKKSAPQDDDE